MMVQLNDRKEWVGYFDSQPFNYYMIRWFDGEDNREYEEPVYFKRKEKDGEVYYQEYFPLVDRNTDKIEYIKTQKPLPNKIIVVKGLLEEYILENY